MDSCILFFIGMKFYFFLQAVPSVKTSSILSTYFLCWFPALMAESGRTHDVSRVLVGVAQRPDLPVWPRA